MSYKKIRHGDRIKDGKGWFSAAFLAPSLALYTCLIIAPILLAVFYSLTKWNGIGAPTFIGLNNFTRLFASDEYWVCFKNTLTCIGWSLLIQISLGLVLAYLLYTTKIGYRFFRSVFFLPAVISPAAIGTMFLIFFNGELGPLNSFLTSIGLSKLAMNWLSDSRTVLYAVMFPMIWQYIGHYILIFLAGIQAIPEEIFESAKIDGANSFQIFFHMVVPMVLDLIGTCIVLCFTGSVKAFDQAYVMTAGGPGVRSSYLAIEMYKTAFTENKLGLGIAIAITMLVLSLVFTLLFNRFRARIAPED